MCAVIDAEITLFIHFQNRIFSLKKLSIAYTPMLLHVSDDGGKKTLKL